METERLIGKRLKDFREKNKFTQQQIADYLELDQSMIAKIENDERPISLTSLQLLSNLYGCVVGDLVNPMKNPCKPLVMAYRASSLTREDMRSIAQIKKIVLNLRMMEKLLEDSRD